mgnify:CR=1 FL=1
MFMFCISALIEFILFTKSTAQSAPVLLEPRLIILAEYRHGIFHKWVFFIYRKNKKRGNKTAC